MPRKRNEQYEKYEQRKLYFYFSQLSAIYGDIGEFFSEKYKYVHDRVVNAYASSEKPMSDGAILGINNTHMVMAGDQSQLNAELQESINEITQGIKKYNGPFKDYLVALNYIYNPANGDILEAIMDNPSLERIIGSFSDGPVLLSKIEKNGITNDVLDKKDNQEREKALGEFGPLCMGFYKSLAGYVKVIFDRQKAEAEGKTGLDSEYTQKYSDAIDNLVDKYDKLRKASEKRYKRGDLNQQEKDLKFFPGTQNPILNNEISELTSNDPNKISRSGIWTAIENLRAQSKAIKNGWPVKEATIMGLVAEAKYNAEQSLDFNRRDLKTKKEELENLKSQKIKPEEIELHNQKIKEQEAKYKELEDSCKIYEKAANESDTIYKKYTDMRKPDYFFRRDALREVNEYVEKYKDSCKQTFTKNLCGAVNNNTKDPFDFEGKTRAQQAKSILKSLEDVDQFMRSSTNFDILKKSVKKLVEMAEKYPEMNKAQFKKYESQMLLVRKYARRYLRGKKTEDDKYRKKHKNEPLKRSEYTSKRINAVELIEDKLYSHMALTSDGFTKEYTGTAHERVLARYERIIKLREKHLMKILGNNVVYDTEGGESINASNEYTSFLRSVYVEKMRERYEYDPHFTAYDFMHSLRSYKIDEGSKKIREEMRNHPEFLEHMKVVLRERINVATDNMEEVYDTTQYVIDDPIPDGVGQEWIRYELKNYRAMYDIPEPSRKDYVSDSESEIEDEISEKEEKKEIEEKVSEKEEKKEIEEKVSEKEEKKEIEEKVSEKEEKKEIEEKVSEKEEKKEIEEKVFEKEETKEEKKEDKKKDKKASEKTKEEMETSSKNLAGLVYDALSNEGLLRYSRDPLYREIAKDFETHSAKEEPGKNTKISNATMMKMAKYIDKAYDMLNKKMDLSEDDVARRTIVESAYRKYSQKQEKFEKSAGEFEPNPPIFDPVFGYNHGEGLYKPLFNKTLDSRLKKNCEKFMADPNDMDLSENVLNNAYQVIMVENVENTTAKEKGVTYDSINKDLEATSDKKQIRKFIKEYIAPKEFKNTFEKMILDAAKEGRLSKESVIEVCDKAIAKTIDECKNNKDIVNEKQTRDLAEKLHRKIKKVKVSQSQKKKEKTELSK